MTRLETAHTLTSDDAPDVEVSITTDGDGAAAETIHMHLQNELHAGFSALVGERPPDEYAGRVNIDWERRFEIIADGEEGDGS